MGSTYIQGFLEQGVSRRQALAIHLQSNHYPPVHSAFIPVCEWAIERALEDDWSSIIEMPNGITKSVGDIVEGLHLYSFIEDDGADSEDKDPFGVCLDCGVPLTEDEEDMGLCEECANV